MHLGRIAFALAFLVSQAAAAGPVTRDGTLPNEGAILQGDLWTFTCPPGGTVTITVDTTDDNNLDQALVDPIFYLYDGTGTVLDSADDTIACSSQPVCGADRCPQLVNEPCGSGNPHAIGVRDYGVVDNGCPGPGGYRLTVEVFKGGVSVDAKKVKLGGGAKRKVPKSIDPDGLLLYGPALDDEALPN